MLNLYTKTTSHGTPLWIPLSFLTLQWVVQLYNFTCINKASK